jgi:hypothetical protein
MKLAKLFDKFEKEEREFFGIGTDFFLFLTKNKDFLAEQNLFSVNERIFQAGW